MFFIISGSDQEKAIVLGLEKSFKEAVIVFCTLHLKKNLKRYMLKKLKTSNKQFNGVYRRIFGTHGIIHTRHGEEFDTFKENLLEKYGKLFEGSDYLIEFLDRIEKNVMHPAWVTNRISVEFTNNDSETFNSIIKGMTQGDTLALPDLVTMFASVFNMQRNYVMTALQGFGKYLLQDWMLPSFSVKSKQWHHMSREERLKKYQKFSKGLQKRPSNKPRVVSKNGLIEMQSFRKRGAKPGTANKKTKTVNKKSKPENVPIRDFKRMQNQGNNSDDDYQTELESDFESKKNQQAQKKRPNQKLKNKKKKKQLVSDSDQDYETQDEDSDFEPKKSRQNQKPKSPSKGKSNSRAKSNFKGKSKVDSKKSKAVASTSKKDSKKNEETDSDFAEQKEPKTKKSKDPKTKPKKEDETKKNIGKDRRRLMEMESSSSDGDTDSTNESFGVFSQNTNKRKNALTPIKRKAPGKGDKRHKLDSDVNRKLFAKNERERSQSEESDFSKNLWSKTDSLSPSRKSQSPEPQNPPSPLGNDSQPEKSPSPKIEHEASKHDESPAKAERVKRKTRKPDRLVSDASTDSNDIPEIPYVPYVSKSYISGRSWIQKKNQKQSTKMSLSSALNQDLVNLCTPRNLRSKKPPSKEEKMRERIKSKRLKKTPPYLKSPFLRTDGEKNKKKKKK